MTHATRLVFLVPGFFGFTSVGAVSYFERVEQALGRALQQRGVAARIVRCKTQPTASIPRRVDVLRRQVLRHGGLDAEELHFVGHSTGGLDVRMLLSPGVTISRSGSEERIARLTRSATSVATPHHGTPLANDFLSLQGQTLLLVLSALATSGQGRGTILAAARAIAMVARLDDRLGRPDGPLDCIAEGLLRQIRFSRPRPSTQPGMRWPAPLPGAARHQPSPPTHPPAIPPVNPPAGLIRVRKVRHRTDEPLRGGQSGDMRRCVTSHLPLNPPGSSTRAARC